MLLLWWGPPVLTAAISALYMPVFLPRTLTPTLVPCYLAVSAALARTPGGQRTIGASGCACSHSIASIDRDGVRPATEQWDRVDSFLQRNVAPATRLALSQRQCAPAPCRRAAFDLRPARHSGGISCVGVPGPIRAGSPAVVSLTREGAARFAAGGREAAHPHDLARRRPARLLRPALAMCRMHCFARAVPVRFIAGAISPRRRSPCAEPFRFRSNCQQGSPA